ncbi:MULTISPECIES: helix-turn-helix transcriptional regulator [Pseudoalteromonas]|uniref:helix-turn-helix transcriptional regulator n=1 Tax=Pseudoalteromonas TaxID=53246 RepID=UPI001EF67EC8|nr:helix-turn-helix transcriptional regulator [Pseudoalteromonas sp. Of11M-6]MCG7556079.1 helix-turn-helix transcriptional regulator [Pseudoalteromonas sp. Of11M-6]
MRAEDQNENERREQTSTIRHQVQLSIKEMRLSLGLSQKELGQRMKPTVDQSTVSNWEKGKSEVSLSQLYDILLICGQSLSSYVGFLEKKED